MEKEKNLNEEVKEEEKLEKLFCCFYDDDKRFVYLSSFSSNVFEATRYFLKTIFDGFINDTKSFEEASEVVDLVFNKSLIVSGFIDLKSGCILPNEKMPYKKLFIDKEDCLSFFRDYYKTRKEILFHNLLKRKVKGDFNFNYE